MYIIKKTINDDSISSDRNISEICLEISKLIKHSNISAEECFKIDELLWEIIAAKNKTEVKP